MGKVSGGMKCIKYLLFFFNLIFWLAGSAVLGIALWLRFDKNTTSLFGFEGSSSSFFVGVYILLAAGALMMLVGFCGCCGAIQESQCLLGSFFACLLVIFAAEVTAGVFGFLNSNKIVEEVKNLYTESLTEFQGGNEYPSNDTLLVFHTTLDCCGNGENTDNLKDTCPGQGETSYKKCSDQIEDFFKTKLYIIGIVGLGIAGIMIFGMIFSMVLCCAIRNSRDML